MGERPVALFLPGIAGCSSAEYLRTLVPLAYGVGYQPVVLNYRGLTSTPLLNSRLYCALNFEDLETTLKHIKNEANGDVKIIATALSMGGTILAGYLTSRGVESLIDAAFMASVVWDAAAGARNLESGFWNRDINKMMTKSLIKIVQRHRSWFEDDPKYDLKEVEKCKKLKAFDETFTRKMFGFDSAEEYYTACTYKDKVHLIKVPTLLLQAADDMMANEKGSSSNYSSILKLTLSLMQIYQHRKSPKAVTWQWWSLRREDIWALWTPQNQMVRAHITSNDSLFSTWPH